MKMTELKTTPWTPPDRDRSVFCDRRGRSAGLRRRGFPGQRQSGWIRVLGNGDLADQERAPGLVLEVEADLVDGGVDPVGRAEHLPAHVVDQGRGLADSGIGA